MYEKEGGYTFLRGKGAELVGRGEDLYLFFRDEGVMKLSPVSAFVGFAHAMKAADLSSK